MRATPPGRIAVRGARLVAREIWRAKSNLLTALSAGFVWILAMVGGPLLLREGINKGVLARSTKVTLIYAGLVIAVGVVQGAASAVRRYNAFKMAYRVETTARARMFEHLQRLHLAFHDGFSSGQLISRAASDLNQVSNFCVNIPITLSSIVILLATASLMFYFSAPLAAVSLAPVVGLLAASRLFNARAARMSTELQQRLGAMSELAEQIVRGIRTVKGLGLESKLGEAAAHVAASIKEKAFAVAALRALYGPLQPLSSSLGLLGTAGFGAYLAYRGEMKVGTLVAYLAYLNMLSAPLGLITYTIALAPRALASAARVAEVLQARPEITDPPRPKRLPLTRDPLAVAFENVTFYYPRSSRPALSGFSLGVAPGSAVALVGPSGAGKTTVLNLLARFYDPQEGRVTFDGIDIRELRLSELRRAIGFVFEDAYLFSDTVHENIAFGRPEATREEVIEAAKIAGAHEFIESLPDGYDTHLGTQGLTLSGGQRQRIAIARAILTSPRLLVLDDATSAVDALTEKEILQAMKAVMQERTSILIAHRPATIELATEVAFLRAGRLVAKGTHEELRRTCPEYAEYFATLTGGLDAGRAGA